jgi:uncharacterized OB-fold protein
MSDVQSADGGQETGDRPWSRRPKPIPTPFTDPFWEATRAGRLVIQRCSACGEWRWPPQPACPECWSDAFAWTDTAGTGSIYSYTVISRPVDRDRFPARYVLGVVELDEGPRLLTNLVDCTEAQLAIGTRVQVRFQALDDEFTVYPFAPVDGDR